MRLTNEFAVDVPVERTWEALLDVPGVARALPGATVEPEPVDGAYRGRMRLALGAVTTEYAGTVRLEEVDDDERVARFLAIGREAGGRGSAAATIASRVTGDGGRTRVTVETDLDVTGLQAQLGAGLVQEVAGSVLDRFAEGLERLLQGEETAPAAGDALDVGRIVAGPLAERAALVAAGAAAGLAVGWAVWGRR